MILNGSTNQNLKKKKKKKIAVIFFKEIINSNYSTSFSLIRKKCKINTKKRNHLVILKREKYYRVLNIDITLQRGSN